jgi:hypothetical protein
MDSTTALNAHPSPAQPDPASTPQPSPVPAAAHPPATAATHSMVASGGEQCPSCGVHVAPDQRYCLHCGARCGEPRLPFMNAVTFMDAMKPRQASVPPPKRKLRRLSPNAALIAGVGTLLMAMGVGVLIGRSNNGSSTAPTQAAAPIVIKSNGAAEEAGAAAGKNTIGGGGAKGKAPKQKKANLKKEAETQAGAEEVLKPTNGVKLPPATIKPGGKCESGAAGCKHGEFTGEFFGE